MFYHGDTVELVQGDALETFGTIVGYTSVSEAVELLQALDVPTPKLRGLVAAHALAEVGLD